MTTRIESILTARDATKAAFESFGRSLDGVQGKVTGLVGKFGGVTAVVAGVTAGFAALENIQALKILDQLDDMSEKTGITVERLSALRFAGESVGTPLEALNTGISRLGKLMAEAAGGNKEAIATFKTLAIEIRNTDGSLRSNDEVLTDLAERFAGYQDGLEKGALAQKVFGKSGADMIPLLNQGASGLAALRKEAEQLGVIYDSRTAKAAAEFNDNLTKIKLAAEAQAVSISGPLIGALAKLSGQYLEAKKNGESFLPTLTSILSYLTPGGQLVLAGKLATGTVFDSKTRERADALANLQPEDMNDAVYRRFQRARTQTPAPIVPSGGGGGKEKAAKDAEAETKRYLESLTKQVEKVKELSQVEQSLAEIQRIRLGGGKVSEEQKQQILLQAAAIDAAKEQGEVEKAQVKEREEAQRRLFALQDEGKRVFEETRTPLEEYNAEVERLNKLYEQGAISAATQFRAVDLASQKYQEAEKRAREAADSLDSFGKRAAENIQDQLGQGLADAAEGNFQNIGESFRKMLVRMAAEAAAADLTRAMFGDLAKGGSGTGLFGGLFGAGGAGSGSSSSGAGSTTGDLLGSIASGFGGWLSGLMKFDTGTDYVPQDMIAVIHKGEKIIPAAQNKPGAGQPVIIQLTQNVGDIATASMLRDANESTKRQIAAALERSRRYGGVGAS